MGKEYHERYVYSDEEAESVVLHFSTDVNEKEKRWRSRLIYSSSKKDWVDKGRRWNPKSYRGEKKQNQRIKNSVWKKWVNAKQCIEDKKENEQTARHPKNTWRLKRCKEHPRNQMCERILIFKIKDEKGKNHHVSKWNCQCLRRIT